jgi:hypothetical protein
MFSEFDLVKMTTELEMNNLSAPIDWPVVWLQTKHSLLRKKLDHDRLEAMTNR